MWKWIFLDSGHTLCYLELAITTVRQKLTHKRDEDVAHGGFCRIANLIIKFNVCLILMPLAHDPSFGPVQISSTVFQNA